MTSDSTRPVAGLVPNLVVAEPPGFRPLHLDLHLPAADPGRPGPHPVLFWIHGGGWRSGSRLQLPATIAPHGFHRRFLARGWAVADVDYRLTGEAVFPAQLDDVRAAVDWAVANAAEFGLDPGRFAALGESAGGHLAALAGLDPHTRLGAVIAWYTPADLLGLDRGPGSPEALLLGAPPSQVPEPARAASPLHQVRAGSPPFQCVHGTGDGIVPFGQSQALTEALRAHGVRADLIAVPGAGHCFEGHDDIGALIDAGVDFVDDVLPGR